MLSSKTAAIAKSNVFKTEKVVMSTDEKDTAKQRIRYEDWYFHKC